MRRAHRRRRRSPTTVPGSLPRRPCFQTGCEPSRDPSYLRAKLGATRCPSAGWIGGEPGELEHTFAGARLRVGLRPPCRYTARAMDPTPLPMLFERALASGRLHSAYLISGPRDAAREAAVAFARASVCERQGGRLEESVDAQR